MPATRSQSSALALGQAPASTHDATVGAPLVPVRKKIGPRKKVAFIPTVPKVSVAAASLVPTKGKGKANPQLSGSMSDANNTNAISEATSGNPRNSFQGLPNKAEAGPTKKIVKPASILKKSAKASSSVFAEVTKVATRNEPEAAQNPHGMPANFQPDAETRRYPSRARSNKPEANLTKATLYPAKTSNVGRNAASAKGIKPSRNAKGVLTGRVTKRASKTSTSTYDGKKRNHATLQDGNATTPGSSDKGKDSAGIETDKGENDTESKGQETNVEKARIIKWVFIHLGGMWLVSEKVPPILLGTDKTSES